MRQVQVIALVLSMLLSCGAARAMTVYDFNVNDGGFMVQTVQQFNTPWTHSLTAGVGGTGGWVVNQDQNETGFAMTTRLISPPQPIEPDLLMSFDHRFSLEQGSWDGGAVMVSVNGGSETYVPGSFFLANGYTGTVLANSASALAGMGAFVLDSPGHQTPAYLNSTLRLGDFLSTLGSFTVADNVQVTFLYAGDTNTRGTFLPSWEIDNVIFDPEQASVTVPEPATAGLGLLTLAGLRRRRGA